MDNINGVSKEARSFIKNISKKLDSILLHTESMMFPQQRTY